MTTISFQFNSYSKISLTILNTKLNYWIRKIGRFILTAVTISIRIKHIEYL